MIREVMVSFRRHVPKARKNRKRKEWLYYLEMSLVNSV